jgi:hypothetical protein
VIVVGIIFVKVADAVLNKKEEKLEKQAEQGDTQLQFKLGMKNKNSNPFRALYWLQKAADQGVEGARSELEDSQNKLIPWFHEHEFENIEPIMLCCDELVKAGYLFTFDNAHSKYATINICDAKGKKIGLIEFGIRGPGHKDAMSLGEHLRYRHIMNEGLDNGELKHIIHLDEYDILIRSEVPWNEAVPRWLIVCAKVLVSGYKIRYPLWSKKDIDEQPIDVSAYVNTAFRELGYL